MRTFSGWVTGLLIGWAGGMAMAEDWPEFRGSTGMGQSSATGLPTTWGPAKNVVWKAAVPGLGWSSPVVAGERVYVTTAVDDRPALSLRVLAFDVASGKPAWQREVFSHKSADAPRIHQKNSHASPTALVEGGRVYAHFGHLGTACLDAATGEVIWSTREIQYNPVHGAGGSPVVAGDLLIFNADAAQDPQVVALDKATGSVRWRFPRVSEAKRKFSFSTPLLIEVGGARQLITPGSGVVNALDPATGQEVWRATYDQGYSVVPRPVFAEGMIFVSSGYDNPVAMAVRVDGKGDVTKSHVVWETDKRAPRNASMVVAEGLLYMAADSGVLSCLDAKTGKVHYEERACGPISASLLHAGGHLYLQDENGQGIVVKPGRQFRVVAKNDLKERALASYAVCGSDLLIRTASQLYRIGMR